MGVRACVRSSVCVCVCVWSVPCVCVHLYVCIRSVCVRERQTDRQTETDRQTDRQTERDFHNRERDVQSCVVC